MSGPEALVLLALFAPVEVGFAGVGNFLCSCTLVALRLHPAIKLGGELFSDCCKGRLLNEIDETMRVFFDIIELLRRPPLVFGDHGLGMRISLLCFFLPADPEIGFAVSSFASDSVCEGCLWVKVPDVAVAGIATTSDAIGITTVDNTPGGLQSVGVFLLLVGIT